MADKIATRESYGSALVELAEKYDFVVLDADLAEATKTVHYKPFFSHSSKVIIYPSGYAVV